MHYRVFNVFFDENIVQMCWILEIDQLLRKPHLWNNFSFNWLERTGSKYIFFHSENGDLVKDTLIWSENKM
jgi:hypothetical protein